MQKIKLVLLPGTVIKGTKTATQQNVGRFISYDDTEEKQVSDFIATAYPDAIVVPVSVEAVKP